MTFTEAEAAAKKLADGGWYSVGYNRMTSPEGKHSVTIHAHTHLYGDCQQGSGVTYEQAIADLGVSIDKLYAASTTADQPPTCAQGEG